jgi:lysophospholipase L1-like esterase
MKKPIKIALTVAFVLLILFLLLLVVAKNFVPLNASFYRVKYAISGYPEGQTLLIGSSTMQKWTSSKSDLAPIESANIGISGSVVEHWAPLTDKLIIPFAPEKLVIYLGANDLHALKHTAEDTAAELIEFLDGLHTKLPDTKMYCISVYTIGSMPELLPVDDAFNLLMSEYADNCGWLTFIDISRRFRDADGAVDKSFLANDLVHLSAKGYEVWAEAVKSGIA